MTKEVTCHQPIKFHTELYAYIATPLRIFGVADPSIEGIFKSIGKSLCKWQKVQVQFGESHIAIHRDMMISKNI